MAKCVDYQTGKDCPHFYRCSGKDERVQVGTSMKKLDQFCFYCKATPGMQLPSTRSWSTSTTRAAEASRSPRRSWQ